MEPRTKLVMLRVNATERRLLEAAADTNALAGSGGAAQAARCGRYRAPPALACPRAVVRGLLYCDRAPAAPHARAVAQARRGLMTAPLESDLAEWMVSDGETRNADEVRRLALEPPAANARRFRLLTDVDLASLPEPVPVIAGTLYADSLACIVGKY